MKARIHQYEPGPQDALGVTVEGYADAVNKALAVLGTDYAVSFADGRKGKLAAFGKINEQLAVNVSLVPGTEDVAQVVFIGTSDGTMVAGAGILLGAAACIMAVNPDMDRTRAGGMVLDMLEPGKPHAVTVDGLRYSMTKPEGLGVWLSIMKEQA